MCLTCAFQLRSDYYSRYESQIAGLQKLAKISFFKELDEGGGAVATEVRRWSMPRAKRALAFAPANSCGFCVCAWVENVLAAVQAIEHITRTLEAYEQRLANGVFPVSANFMDDSSNTLDLERRSKPDFFFTALRGSFTGACIGQS